MIESICICGAGTMGAGIAQVAAQSGLSVRLYDFDPMRLPAARQQIESGWNHLVAKNKMSLPEVQGHLGRISYTSDQSACRADLLLEAIVEELAAKQALFRRLYQLNGEAAIYATNTSSLSVATIAEAIPNPHRMAGMHFFNPAPIMKLVEIVQTDSTDTDVAHELIALSIKCGKVPVLCRDAPGFIVNHVARPFYLEALRLLESGIADTNTIDELMEASGFKMGPFRLMDLIGNDINYTVSQTVYEAMGRPPRLRPSSLQEKAVREGRLGKKTGKGYYDYGAEQAG